MRIILTGLLLLSLGSCTGPEKLICLDWKVDSVKFKQGDSGTNFNIDQQKRLEAQLKTVVSFRFYADSSYVMAKAGDTLYGKWYLTEKKKKLVTNIGNVDVWKFGDFVRGESLGLLEDLVGD